MSLPVGGVTRRKFIKYLLTQSMALIALRLSPAHVGLVPSAPSPRPYGRRAYGQGRYEVRFRVYVPLVRKDGHDGPPTRARQR